PQFNVSFAIEEAETGEMTLVFEITTDSGYYFVSPHSEGLLQRLIFSTANTEYLSLTGELVERPLTWQEVDGRSGKKGRFVRKQTTYYQSINVKTETNFNVAGLIWLEILPSNQPYEVGFLVSKQAGKLTVEKISIQESSYPTFSDKKRLDVPVK
ncbi:MAG: hypothetical protein AB8B72_10605, partial [Crocinitomicaceae bacterium]